MFCWKPRKCECSHGDVSLPGTRSVMLKLVVIHLPETGQVVNVLREERAPRPPGVRPQLTSHVCIPAAYRAGITLFVHRSAPVCQELQHCPDLPLEDSNASVNSAGGVAQKGPPDARIPYVPPPDD